MVRTAAIAMGLFSVLLITHPTILARTLEKKEEANPVLRLKREQQETRKKEQKAIDDLKGKIRGLDSELNKLDSRLIQIKGAGKMNRSALDEMHNLVNRKEGLLKELEDTEKDLSEKETKLNEENSKRREELETLKAEMKKDQRKQRTAALKQDLRKYEKIISSHSVKDMDIQKSAWKALAVKYPKEAKGLDTGDVEKLQFRVNYGGMTNSIGMRFVLVQCGKFRMGSPSSEKYRSRDEIRHEVTIKKPFYLQTTEVTQRQWAEIMGENPSDFKKCGDKCPVENVSWDDCQEFIRKLNERERTHKYRLPTEAEWEFACRAGKGAAFANGGISESGCGLDSNLDQMGWYCANSKRKTHPVARKKISAWGLYDMHGNVWEWCQDWWGKYPKGSVVDPKGARYGPKRVIRGGSCLNYAEKCRSAYRYSYKTNIKMNNIGLRVARTK